MKKIFYLLIPLLAVAALFFWWRTARPAEPVPPGPQVDLSDESAELTGRRFVELFIASAPPEGSRTSALQAKSMLSKQLMAEAPADPAAIPGYLAGLMGVQDVPDQGVSTEDLQIVEKGRSATLIVGLNYSGTGQVIRNIHLVGEGGVWKVDGVSPGERGAN